MATKKESAAQAVENAVETVEKVEAATEEKDDGMVTIHLFKDDDRYSAPVFVGVNGDSYLIQRGIDRYSLQALAAPGDFVLEVFYDSRRSDKDG